MSWASATSLCPHFSYNCVCFLTKLSLVTKEKQKQKTLSQTYPRTLF